MFFGRNVRESKDERSPWQLAGDGWRDVLMQSARALASSERAGVFNAPRTSRVDDNFERYLGIRPSESWSWHGMNPSGATDKLEGFVNWRNEIAHRGRSKTVVRRVNVTAYQKFVLRLAEKTDARIMSVLRKTRSDARKLLRPRRIRSKE